MKICKTRNWIAAGITISLVCTTGIITSLAYNPPKEVVVDTYHDTCDYFYNPNLLAEQETVPLPSNNFWIDVNGVTHEISGSDGRKICRHVYEVSGEVGYHKKKRNGKCSITYKEVLVCLRCEKRKAGKLLRTVNYSACTHR